MILCQKNEATATRRRMYFHCVDAIDGMTPEVGEVGGQPQVSVNGAAWGNTSGVLVAIGNGRYYVELTQVEVNVDGVIEGRYKSANTAESIGTPIQTVPWDPYDVAGLGTTNLDATVSSRNAVDPATEAELNARTLPSADYFDASLDVVTTDAASRTASKATGFAVAGDSMALTAAAVDAVWDELLTGATHNVATSAGRRLRQAEDTTVMDDGTATAGGDLTIQLEVGSSADDTWYLYTLVVLTGGTGAGQARHVESYDGATRTITVDRAWATNPDATTEYTIYPWSRTHVHILDTAAMANVNTAVDTALDTAIPGAPTADSINEHIKAVVDTYHADIYLTIDEANTRDEYTVTWFKNGVRVAAGITVPKIQVVKRADGTDLVAETAMTQVGTTGSYKYDEDTNRLTAGEAAIAVVTATIGAGGRSFAAVIGRDSSA